MAKSAKKAAPGTIAQNRRARHDYFIEQKFEAGVMLMGWEVKSIRDGKVQLAESYVQLHKGEAFLAGCNITPLLSASTHVVAEPQRVRKLLLHAKELAQLFAASQQKGYTIVPLAMYWKGNKVKCEIAWVRARNSMTNATALNKKIGSVTSSGCSKPLCVNLRQLLHDASGSFLSPPPPLRCLC